MPSKLRPPVSTILSPNRTAPVQIRSAPPSDLLEELEAKEARDLRHRRRSSSSSIHCRLRLWSRPVPHRSLLFTPSLASFAPPPLPPSPRRDSHVVPANGLTASPASSTLPSAMTRRSPLVARSSSASRASTVSSAIVSIPNPSHRPRKKKPLFTHPKKPSVSLIPASPSSDLLLRSFPRRRISFSGPSPIAGSPSSGLPEAFTPPISSPMKLQNSCSKKRAS